MRKKIAWSTVLSICCLIGIVLWSFLGIFSYVRLTDSLLQGEGELSGKVIDASTEKPIKGAQIRMGNASAQTGPNGNFIIKGPIGTYNMTVSKGGYQTTRMEVWAGPSSQAVGEKELEQIRVPRGEGVVDLGKGNTIGLRENILGFVNFQLYKLVLSILLTLPAIVAAFLLYKKMAYRSTLILTFFSMASGGLNGISFALAPIAMLFIIAMKDEFAEVQWANQFGTAKIEPALHYLVTSILIGLAVFLIVNAVLIFLAPLAIPPNSLPDLTALDNKEFQELAQPWRWVYEQGDFFCHQIPTRSFSLNGNQLPYCARCTGIRIGYAAGLLLALFKKFKINLKFALLLAMICILPVSIDGVGQTYLGLWESVNFSRLITGLLLGAFTIFAIAACLRELELQYFEK
ncbi:MAG TPA: DUF2085 domain-containing protein [Thermoplasmata archaeon]|nr:DUF2085 domain-containing protein [Thermoplasmata archaeon]